MSWRSGGVALFAVLLFAGAVTAFFLWRESPSQEVSRLLQEKKRNQRLHLFGRTDQQIDADFDRLGARAVPALIEALKDPDPSIRAIAAEALGKIGDRRAFEPLLSLLEDDGPQIWSPTGPVRADAVEALGNLGDARAYDILLRILESKDNVWVRSAAARGLGRLGDRRAIPALTRAADDPSWQVKGAAKKSLERLQSE